MYRYIFGPVNSRRLGRSLGIDLVPRKVCSFDCIFCQVGRTTDLTLTRGEHVPTDEVLAEFDAWISGGGTTDFVTLSGSGEPTLHTRFGDILEAVHARSSARTALLSNGSLFYLPEVRAGALSADIIKTSLSAWDQESFEKVNRPFGGLTFRDIVDGIISLRSEYNGELWLEVLVVEGINDGPGDMAKIAELVNRINPDKVHLNTVVRPPAEVFATRVSENVLTGFVSLFDSPTEIVGENSTRGDDSDGFVGVRPIK
ncbi:MAG: radical SAM protein [Kiritimatiellae bacterium]|nr:radical SAM protein [Kiritimatiellia bacterium]